MLSGTLLCSLNLSANFPVWVTVWVNEKQHRENTPKYPQKNSKNSPEIP